MKKIFSWLLISTEGFLYLVGIISVVIFSYNQFLKTSDNQTHKNLPVLSSIETYITKHKKPARIEVQDYVNNPNSKFSEQIQKIKDIKVKYDENSNFYIEIQIFTAESDPAAPLVIQFKFLDIKTKNLLKEESLNLYN